MLQEALRKMLKTLLRKIRYGQVVVEFPDGTTSRYGSDGPAVNVKIKDWGVLEKFLLNASLAVGEGYMDERLEIDDLATFFMLVGKNRTKIELPQWAFGLPRLLTRQDEIAHHYDLGNDVFKRFLDPTMMYSCAYFPRADEDLERAQYFKINHTLSKLNLPPGSRVVDIGCGWGMAAVIAAKEYGWHVTAITLSKEQLKYAQELAKREGVADLVKFELLNFENLIGEFDGGYSIGMYEHVGRGHHKKFFAKLVDILVPGAPFLLHTITSDRTNPVNAWTRKWIFPKGDLPTIDATMKLQREYGFLPIDVEPLWEHYYLTLSRWIDNYTKNREEIIELMDTHPWVLKLGKDGKWFDRMWRFWLEGSRGGFGHGGLNVCQLLFTMGKPEPDKRPLMRAA